MERTTGEETISPCYTLKSIIRAEAYNNDTGLAPQLRFKPRDPPISSSRHLVMLHAEKGPYNNDSTRRLQNNTTSTTAQRVADSPQLVGPDHFEIKREEGRESELEKIRKKPPEKR